MPQRAEPRLRVRFSACQLDAWVAERLRSGVERVSSPVGSAFLYYKHYSLGGSQSRQAFLRRRLLRAFPENLRSRTKSSFERGDSQGNRSGLRREAH
jgi:hypothetical protein